MPLPRYQHSVMRTFVLFTWHPLVFPWIVTVFWMSQLKFQFLKIILHRAKISKSAYSVSLDKSIYFTNLRCIYCDKYYCPGLSLSCSEIFLRCTSNNILIKVNYGVIFFKCCLKMFLYCTALKINALLFWPSEKTQLFRNDNRIIKKSWDPKMTIGDLLKSNSSVSFHISLCINMTLKSRTFPDSIIWG